MGMRSALLLLLLAGAPQGAPTFTEVDVGLSGVQGSEVNWGDYDNDGDLDLALLGLDGAGNRFTRLYRNDAGTFVHESNAAMLGLNEGPFIFGDYDNDGDLDVAFGGWSGGGTGNRIHRNDGGGNFIWLDNGLRGMKGADGAWFDYDNDGDLDLLLAGESYDLPQGDYAQIYRNDKNGAFPLAVDLPGLYVGEVSVGDYDRDGDIDIALTGRTVGTKIFRNDGNGVFTDIAAGLPPLLNSSVAWGDYDNDGDLDLLISGDSPGGPFCDIYRNDAGVFTAINAGLPVMRLGNIDWGDCDNDGDLDLLLVGADAVLSPLAFVYLNQGGGVFSDAGAGLEAVWNQSTGAWGDYDNDGRLDLVIAGINSLGASVVKVYRNTTAPLNTAPSAPTGLTAVWNDGELAVQWNASSDAQTPPAGLSYNLRVGTTSGGQEIMAPMADLATGRRRIPARGNAQGNLSWTLHGLAAGTYYVGVQAVDSAFLASAWSAEVSAASPPPGPRVTAVSPSGTLAAGLGQVVVTLDIAPDPATVNSTSFIVSRAGGDATLGTSDDVVLQPASISLAGTQVTLDFTGLYLPNDQYRIRVRGNEAPIAGSAHWWKLDEGGGSTAQDAVGALHGTLDGAALPTWTAAGRLGGALQFAALDDRVLLSAADLPVPWTAAMWVRRVDSPWVDSRLMDGPTASLRLEQFNGTNRVGLTLPALTDFAYDYAAPVGAWTHLAFVADGSVTSLYVNGILSQHVGIVMGCPRTTLGSVGSNSMSGLLDEVRLFTRRLSEVEIRSLASLGGIVRDLSGNRLDGDYSGSFPTGDGAGGGDFIRDFAIGVPLPRVTAMTPLPGGVLGAAPATISLTCNVPLDPATLSTASVRVTRAGADANLGTGDDVEIALSSVTPAGPDSLVIGLPGGLPADQYRVTLSGLAAEPPGLVHRWRLDEGSGTIATDSAGAAHGTLGGAGGGLPLWTSGRLGDGLRLNGAKDRVQIGAADLAVPWTAAMWAWRDLSTREDSRLIDSPAFSFRLEQFSFSNHVGVTVGGVTDSSFSYAAPFGHWVHLTFTGESDGTSLYVDGVFSQKIPTVLGCPRQALGSGSYNSMVGSLDEVRIYDRKLTEAEIRGVAALGGGCRSIAGILLDGEFSGSFPSGNGVAGGSFLADFTVSSLPPAPGAFSLVAPAAGATGVALSPTYSWGASSGAAGYTLQVATDAGFASLVVDQAGILTTSSAPATLLGGSSVHFWRVTAVNAGGSTLATGAPASFTTQVGPPGAFPLLAPADAATGVSLLPSFTWGPSAGASTYTLQVSTEAGFTAIVVDLPGLTSTSVSPGAALAAGRVYYWRVVAVNGTGSLVSGARAFSTSSGIRVSGGCGLTGMEALGLIGLLALRSARGRRARARR